MTKPTPIVFLWRSTKTIDVDHDQRSPPIDKEPPVLGFGPRTEGAAIARRPFSHHRLRVLMINWRQETYI